VPVRVRVKLKSLTSGRELVVLLAVINTGFVSESPNIVVPAHLVERLRIVLWI